MDNKATPTQTTDFGFQQVTPDQKTQKVEAVFHSVAEQYDLMNDLMSCGLHRVWKRQCIAFAKIHAGERVLDLAGGTGDLTRLIVKQIGETGEVILADRNRSMLTLGRNRLINAGMIKNVHYIETQAESLPFPDDYFDCIVIGFGLRNVTNKMAALSAMFRTLKPGGRLWVLEFSKPVIQLLKPIYDSYSFNILPKLGQWVTGDAASYRYLVESIRQHPDQMQLQTMMEQAGFEGVDFYNLSGGIVAMHRGYKY